MNRLIRRFRCMLPTPFLLILPAAALLMGFSFSTYALPGTSFGEVMMDAFGGFIWSEEMTVEEAASFNMLFLPSAIGVILFLYPKTARLSMPEGYRYRKKSTWYLSIILHCMLIVLFVVLIQVAATLFAGAFKQLDGFYVWVEDIDGFRIKNEWLALFAVAQFFLFDLVIIMFSVNVYLITRKSNMFMFAVVLPTLLGVTSFSKPFAANTMRIINMSMARRLSIEGSFGVPPVRAVITLIGMIAGLVLMGLIIIRFIMPFDKKYS